MPHDAEYHGKEMIVGGISITYHMVVARDQVTTRVIICCWNYQRADFKLNSWTLMIFTLPKHKSGWGKRTTESKSICRHTLKSTASVSRCGIFPCTKSSETGHSNISNNFGQAFLAPWICSKWSSLIRGHMYSNSICIYRRLQQNK